MASINFFTPVKFVRANKTICQSALKFADSYLYIGSKIAKVFQINTKNETYYDLAERKEPLYITIFKIISYITIILPVIALLIKAICRSKYYFKPLPCNIIIEEQKTPIKIMIEIVTSYHRAIKFQLFKEPQSLLSINLSTTWFENLDRILEEAKDEVETLPDTNGIKFSSDKTVFPMILRPKVIEAKRIHKNLAIFEFANGVVETYILDKNGRKTFPATRTYKDGKCEKISEDQFDLQLPT